MAEYILNYVNDSGGKVGIKNPVSLQWSLNDVEGQDGSGTNQLGKTFRDVVTKKQQLACSWGPMTTAELKTLLDYLNQTFLKLEYMDPSAGEIVTKEFYVSSKSAPVYACNLENNEWSWSGLSATLVER